MTPLAPIGLDHPSACGKAAIDARFRVVSLTKEIGLKTAAARVSLQALDRLHAVPSQGLVVIPSDASSQAGGASLGHGLETASSSMH